MKPAELPMPAEVREYGFGLARIARRLFAERCNVAEIAEFLGTRRDHVSTRLRMKAGPHPLIERGRR